MEHEELTKQVIGCAYRVYGAMGHGFLESVYEQCMLIEIAVANQHPIQVRYDGQVVGDFVADLFVENAVIVELKAVRTLAISHEVQLVNYLKATGIDLGLLINFAESKVEVKRKVRVLPQRVPASMS